MQSCDKRMSPKHKSFCNKEVYDPHSLMVKIQIAGLCTPSDKFKSDPTQRDESVPHCRSEDKT